MSFQDIWLESFFLCVVALYKFKLIGRTCPILLVNIINSSLFLTTIPNNWSWGVLFTTVIKVFLGGLCHARFIVCIFETVLSYGKLSCGPGLLIEIMCWLITSSIYSRKIPLAFILVDGREFDHQYMSANICTFLLGLIVLITGCIVVFLYKTLVEIIIVIICIGWSAGVMGLNPSHQIWREKLRRRINNSALSHITTPSL